MNCKAYREWSKHYDPNLDELLFLVNKGVNFDNKTVLEVGCGTGRFTQRILHSVQEIYAIDPDENAIEMCKQDFIESKVSFEIGTLETVSIKPSYYDYVVFSWSMYMIQDKEKCINIAYNAIKPGGKMIVLQANSGEYEEELSALYSFYQPLAEYENAYSIVGEVINNVFGNVIMDTLTTFFVFDSVDQLVEKSLFFIDDEENSLPNPKEIEKFKQRMLKYVCDDGKFKLTDTVSVFIANKKD